MDEQPVRLETAIAVYPADQGACGFFRCIGPAMDLQSKGIGAHTDEVAEIRLPSQPLGTLPPRWMKILGARVQAPVAVWQRPLHEAFHRIIPMVREQGTRVVVEVDDNFDEIDPANINWAACEEDYMEGGEIAEWVESGQEVRVYDQEPKAGIFRTYQKSMHTRQNLRTTIGLADALVVSTDALAEHYGPLAKEVHVVRNRIPAVWLQLAGRTFDRVRKPEDLVVGWTGQVRTHPRDIEQLDDALDIVGVPFKFWCVGTGQGIEEKIGRRPNISSGLLPLFQYPAAYSEFDVALCPLAPTAFSDSKSDLKALEAATLGVVPIMSPTREYLRIHDEGVGLIASTPDEWAQAIELLLTDHKLRTKLKGQGLAYARTQTIEANSHEWLAAWAGMVL